MRSCCRHDPLPRAPLHNGDCVPERNFTAAVGGHRHETGRAIARLSYSAGSLRRIFAPVRDPIVRVLMISDVYFPRINGVSTSIETFRRELHQLGHETLLITPEYPQASQAADPAIRRVRSRYVPRDPEDRMMRRGDIRRLLPELAAAHFDLVHIQTPFIAHYAGVELARRLKLPVVETYHTYFEEYLHHYVPLLPRALFDPGRSTGAGACRAHRAREEHRFLAAHACDRAHDDSGHPAADRGRRTGACAL